MALWKPFRGNRADLDSVLKHDGYVYFCIDDGCLFFDYEDADGKLQRKQINAKEAEALIGYDITTTISASNTEIPTAGAVSTALAGKANATHDHNDKYYTETEIDTKLTGKSDTGHKHAISDVSGLQDALDGKANSSHGTHVTYSTTAPVMDGTASAGTATTVARSDHKHPTDTSRAAKTDFDTHVDDTTKHITSTERTNWGTAYTHSQAAHAPSNAEKNQNAFSNIAVSGQTTVAADTATDTVTFVGSNVTITTDATNDKVTFAVASGSTSATGIVKLTNSTSSTSTTTAATPNSVKSAYDLANTANTAASIAQLRADEAYDLADLAANMIYVGPTEPTDPNIQVWINTAEEGTGVVPLLPRLTTINLDKSLWTGSASPYKQTVSVSSATANTKIDLQPTVAQLTSLQNDDISLMAENNSGAVTIYSFGGKPSSNMAIQAMLMEVSYV